MDKEQIAIERLKEASEMSLACYGSPLVITYSGGKDSEVLLELAKRSGIKFEVNNSHTTADAPQTVYHIRKVFADLENQGIKCDISKPELSMWQLIPKKKLPPTRRMRYCCDYLKESDCANRMIATGVRWAESVRRKKTRGIFEDYNTNQEKKIKLMNDNDDKRMLFERCTLKAKTFCNPIIDFSNEEIWEYYTHECKDQNPLYEMGFNRVGCLGCPMAGKKRLKEFEVFPQYKQMYIHAFDRMLEVRRNENLKIDSNWKNGEYVMAWWLEIDLDQLTLFDEIEDNEVKSNGN